MPNIFEFIIGEKGKEEKVAVTFYGDELIKDRLAETIIRLTKFLAELTDGPCVTQSRWIDKLDEEIKAEILREYKERKTLTAKIIEEFEDMPITLPSGRKIKPNEIK